MGEWPLKTPWRQGHVLTVQSVEQLGIARFDQSMDTVVVIISHDCDLARPPNIEPTCEVIVGRIVDKANGALTWMKSVRRLHLSFTAGTTQIIVELVAADKLSLKKEDLADHIPTPDVLLDAQGLTILQSWLAVRYKRAAFPDEFERRLSKAHEKLTNILANADDSIVAVYFDLDGGDEIERAGPSDPYVLTIILLHSVEKDPAIAMKSAVQAKNSINELFRKRFFVDGKWQEIELRDVFAMSEEGLTVRQARLLKRWNADHLSLRSDPQQPIAEG